MKKRIKGILLASLFAAGSASCSNDFINLLPESNVSVDIMYQNDKDFADALVANYNTLQTQYQDFWIFGDVRGDDSWVQIFKNNSTSYSDLFTTTSSDGLMNTTWRNYYRAIFRANTILEKIEQIDPSLVPGKSRYIGEARFIRALAYFDLVRIFGDVPAVTTTLTIEESYGVPREPVANVYDQIIIPDLIAAEAALPTSYSAGDVGKPTSGAAKALLGRVYITIGDFAEAESKLTEVTTMGYSLLADYNDLFDYGKDEHHAEYIFDIEYESGLGEGSRYTTAFLPNFPDMNSYYDITGAGEEFNNPTPELVALFEEGDSRKGVSIGVTGGFYDNAGEFHTMPTTTNQTYTLKYIASSPVRNDAPCNWKVIRYGDVVLMLAEALNENGKTAEAIGWLNRIRTRAGVDTYPDTTSQSEAREAIATERRLELSFEGVRWFDLLRTGKALDALAGDGMQPHNVLFPLPLSQVQLIDNPDILPQNPGYE
ncbi:MAG: RagB/SusD family nutrient uptake outer membrane protein [Alistipes sp.]|jgi:hypothetical protein|nr:RagB/SusD family nutrient uptake outer membrane protein [Alistipes sp.]